MSKKTFVLWLALFALALGALSGCSQPRRIASVPARNTENTAYTYLALNVSDAAAAARRASQLASQYGGDLVSQRSTVTQGRYTLVLEISIPSSQHSALRYALLRLGSRADERTITPPDDSPRRLYPEPDTTIELHLRQYGRISSPTDDHVVNWDDPLTAALTVITTILILAMSFAIIVLPIMVSVVLVGWAIWALAHSQRNRSA